MASATSKNMQRALSNFGNVRTMFSGVGNTTTVTQKILGWIAFFLVITCLALVIYFIVSIIFKGYSRTLRDMLQWNFSNKVDIKNEFAGKNSALYNALMYLSNNSKNEIDFLRQLGISFDVIGICQDDSCNDVFLNLMSVLDTYYEPEYKENKLNQALVEYIAYHDKITKDLGLKTLTSQQRIQKVNFILNAINDYMQTYTNILEREFNLLCRKNEMKKEEERRIFEIKTKQIAEEKKQYLKQFGIEALTTQMEFANYFIAPVEIANSRCGTSISKIYETLLKKTQHEKYRIDVQLLVKDIQDKSLELRRARSSEEGMTIKEQINDIKQKKLDTEIAMARIRKETMEQARQQQRQEIEINKNASKTQTKSVEKEVKKNVKKVNNAFKKLGKIIDKKIVKKVEKVSGKKTSNVKQNATHTVPQTTKTTNVSSTSVQYEKFLQLDGDENEPLTTVRSDNKMNTVYVPCIEAYMHFVHINSNQAFIRSLVEKGMGTNDIVSYLFLKDLSSLQGQNSEKPFIIRILLMYCAFENIAASVKSFVEDSTILRQPFMNIMLDNGDTSKKCKADVSRYKTILLEASNNNKHDNIVVSTKYTWYITELILMSSPDIDKFFDVSLQRFNALVYATQAKMTYKDMVQYAQKINTFLNITMQNNHFTSPSTQSKNFTRIITGFGIDAKVQEFVQHYPIFSSIYLTYLASLDKQEIRPEDYNNIVTKARNNYNQTRMMVVSLIDKVGLRLDEKFNNTYDHLVYRVHSLKQFMLYAHITHLHFTQYKHVIVEKDKIAKTRYDREGFVELYNEQNMSSKEFYGKLITPFKKDLIDNRVINEWKRVFHADLFNKKSKVSYWIEFEAFWIGTLRPKADQMIKSVWGDVGKSAKLRW